MKIIAEPLENGFYKLIELEVGSCYSIRWTIRSAGGIWDGSNWIIGKQGITNLCIKIIDQEKVV